jgi:hypothetical protein
MGKTKLYTRKLLKRHRAKVAAERAEEVKAEAALRRVPRKWKDHTAEMRKMTEGTQQ